MKPRLCIPLLAAVMAVLSPLTDSTFGQDSVQAELAQLRKLVEAQNTKIDTLSAQIARLSAQIDANNAGRVIPVAAAPAVFTPAPAAAPEPPPTPRVLAAAPKVHIVVKGESLDKIAKTHGITIAELQKLNNITDPKKLQVGQQLTLPPEKKE
jgi:LysM repeat protein